MRLARRGGRRGGARLLTWSRILRVRSGSETSSMTRSSPPQRGQSVMSISNTRFRRCAQVSGAVGGSLQSALVIAEVEGCAAALDLLDGLDGDARLQEYQPIGPRVRSCRNTSLLGRACAAACEKRCARSGASCLRRRDWSRARSCGATFFARTTRSAIAAPTQLAAAPVRRR